MYYVFVWYGVHYTGVVYGTRHCDQLTFKAAGRQVTSRECQQSTDTVT